MLWICCPAHQQKQLFLPSLSIDLVLLVYFLKTKGKIVWFGFISLLINQLISLSFAWLLGSAPLINHSAIQKKIVSSFDGGSGGWRPAGAAQKREK